MAKRRKRVSLASLVAKGFEELRDETRATNAILRGIAARLEDLEVGHTETLKEHQRRLDGHERELRLVGGGKQNGGRKTPNR